MPTKKEKEAMKKDCIIRIAARLIAEALGYSFVTMEDTEDWIEEYGPKPDVNDFNTKCLGSECAQWSKRNECCGLKTAK